MIASHAGLPPLTSRFLLALCLFLSVAAALMEIFASE